METRQQTVPAPDWGYRVKGFGNLLRMGHCAPTVMQTLLDLSTSEGEWPVRMAAGMPGGIGNTGHECGALTSPLVMLGIRDGLREVDRGLPVIFDEGHVLCRDFVACHGTLGCKEIRRKDHFPRHCIRPVLMAPELYVDARDGDRSTAIPTATREGYARLYSHMVENDFHCAQVVLRELGYNPTGDRELFDGTSAFIGGTLFMGRTCSAFTAGVMALGLEAGEIEDSRLRVARLMATMTVGGDATDDRLNRFNPSMNRGYRLSRWFAGEFGSTQCRAITKCDLGDPQGVSDYIEGDRIATCRAIGCRVAEQVRSMLDATGARRAPRPGDRAATSSGRSGVA